MYAEHYCKSFRSRADHYLISAHPYNRGTPGVAIFAKVCFGHQSPSKQQKLHATVYACGARPSCVRCVITSSRLYTTPSVTLRRHKAAAASSPSFARALNYE
ncbi:hypothetical protein [Candidatus Reidiella endopervernicosa]|uniref:Uncharacterized protein n=1 Tax=Candidatus Reidiella endopervernicosa TaxID=2738883 RepID=A0A6N0I0V4_9GAMM|nr:hypothetical protein [Candidatus Reidiella endopervernicosa]QKQ28081.1 hypothetical protein HUE57_18660 [Candidatus Reidiella endopervernicosa]